MRSRTRWRSARSCGMHRRLPRRRLRPSRIRAGTLACRRSTPRSGARTSGMGPSTPPTRHRLRGMRQASPADAGPHPAGMPPARVDACTAPRDSCPDDRGTGPSGRGLMPQRTRLQREPWGGTVNLALFSPGAPTMRTRALQRRWRRAARATVCRRAAPTATGGRRWPARTRLRAAMPESATSAGAHFSKRARNRVPVPPDGAIVCPASKTSPPGASAAAP